MVKQFLIKSPTWIKPPRRYIPVYAGQKYFPRRCNLCDGRLARGIPTFWQIIRWLKLAARPEKQPVEHFRITGSWNWFLICSQTRRCVQRNRFQCVCFVWTAKQTDRQTVGSVFILVDCRGKLVKQLPLIFRYDLCQWKRQGENHLFRKNAFVGKSCDSSYSLKMFRKLLYANIVRADAFPKSFSNFKCDFFMEIKEINFLISLSQM